MAEPTLQQVLDAIAALSTKTDSQIQDVRAEIQGVRAEIQDVRAEIQDVRADVQAVRSDVAAHRTETARGFSDLDAELSQHAEGAHREIDQEVAALKRRLPAKKAIAPRPRRR